MSTSVCLLPCQSTTDHLKVRTHFFLDRSPLISWDPLFQHSSSQGEESEVALFRALAPLPRGLQFEATYCLSHKQLSYVSRGQQSRWCGTRMHALRSPAHRVGSLAGIRKGDRTCPPCSAASRPLLQLSGWCGEIKTEPALQVGAGGEEEPGLCRSHE